MLDIRAKSGLQRPVREQIDGATEQRLHRIAEIDVSNMNARVGIGVFELDDEIEVAARRVESV